jgi:lipid II isoglutaminyl synthase (glutamine-hydrolysing)
MRLHIGYLYPELLNLYGDNGNVEILKKRAEVRGIEVQVTPVGLGGSSELWAGFDLIVMGGGPDSSQKSMYDDLCVNKGTFLRDYIRKGGVGLYVCGSYQLLGRYYKASDGSVLDGLGVFDIHTEHFGNHRPRCIGNVVCELDPAVTGDTVFSRINTVGNTLVGFENHGGRTYLGAKAVPLARVISGHGNNSEDGTEGLIFENSIGTYLHGPFLSKNPHIADLLIAKSVGLDNLSSINDSLILSAHTASLNLKR